MDAVHKITELVIDALVAQSTDFNARGVSDVLWSFATLRDWPPTVLMPLLTSIAAQLKKALYGITRAGYDFTGDFQAWLVVNLFVPSLNEPGILNLWHEEDNATMIKRAVNLKEYLKGQQEQTGKNLREIVSAENMTTAVKHGDWGLLLDEYDRDVEADDLGPAGRDLSTVANYIDDCKMQSESRREKATWTVIKLMYAGSDESEGGTFLGVKDGGPGVHGKDYVTTLGMTEYIQHMLRECIGKTGYGLKFRGSPGQEGTAPDTEELETDEATAQVAQLQATNAELAEQVKRISAEFQNFRRRQEEEAKRVKEAKRRRHADIARHANR